ncbi:DUF7118 family protein [Natrialbaceae archaeon A-gly3]
MGEHASFDHVDRLEDARRRLAEIEARIDDHGEETVTQAAEAYREASKLLEDYVDRATGTGREEFKSYIELEGQFATLVENLPDDLRHREAFEDALEAIDKRRLSERDFERAEEYLEPAATFSELFDEREDAREELEEAKKAAHVRLREIESETADCERLLELGDADLEAPVERLREPIEAYNGAITEAFEEFYHDAAAREIFAVLERSEWYPLVDFESPPDDLEAYVAENPAGEYTIPELLEYAGYSNSKLSHYVSDAGELKRNVATQQTYLEGIDAEPLTIAWPPADRETLRYRVREIRPFAERIGGEEVVAALRAVRALTDDPDYDRLQRAAVAIVELEEGERKRLAAGEVETELERLHRERESIEGTLESD